MQGYTGKYIACLMLALTFTALSGCDLFVSDSARVEKAKRLLGNGEHRTAIIELKKLLQSSPDHGEGRLLLGQAELGRADFAAAEKELRRARELGVSADKVMTPLAEALLAQGSFEVALEELDPSTVDQVQTQVQIFILRGDAYLGLGKLGEAERSFRDALGLQPDALDPLIGLARVEQGRKNFKAAEDYVGAVVKSDPANVRGWLTAGELKMAQRNFAAAETAFTRALESASKPTIQQEFIGRSGLSESQWRQGKSAEALKNVERSLQLAPGHPRPRYFRALMAYGAGDYEVAIDNLQQVLRVAPNYRPAQLLLGAAHYAQGNLEQADMYVSSMLAADPSNVFARKLLAATRLRQDKAQDAVDALRPALAQGGSDTELFGLMSRASFQTGDAETGLLYLERGAKADPENEALQLQLAAGYLTAGDLEQAIEILERLPETKEGAYRREVLLILAYLRKRDTDSAIAQGRKLIETHPNDAGAYNLAATVYMASRRLSEARRYLDKAAQLQPSNVAVLLNLGRLDYAEGKQDDARARFERVLSISPKSVTAMVALAQLSSVRGDQNQATEWLQRAAAVDSKAIRTQLLLLRQYLATRDLERARVFAKELAEAHPKDADAQNALGVTQIADQKYQEAVASFGKAAKLSPKDANLHYNVARAQLALRNFGEAKRALSKAIELAPSYVPAISSLASIEMQEGKAKEALGRARALQQHRDTKALGHVLEGDLHMMQRKFSEAIRAYDIAATGIDSAGLALRSYQARRQARIADATGPLEEWLIKRPDDHRVRFVLAQGYQERGELKKAAAEYELLLKGNPDNAIVLNNLAWVYQGTGDARAIDVAERAHKLQPESGAITDTLGWLLVQQGDIQRGLELLQDAAKQAPNIPDIRYHLAVALLKSGAKEEARKILTEVLNSGATFAEINKAKQLLKEL